MTSVAAAATLEADVRALEMVRPSAAPFTTGSDLVSSANLRACSLPSIMRRNSRPPAWFLALVGTTKPSPGAACTAPYLALSELDRSHGGATASLTDAGRVLAISPSSQEPHQMNSALPSSTACWVVVWSRPAAPA